MTIKLRPYQEVFVKDVRTSLARHRSVIAAMATGAGKTKVFITIAQSAIARGRTVLVISESIKIFKQIAEELPAIHISGGVENFYIHPSKLYIAMAQTLSRRSEMIAQFSLMGDQLLIITDEAHISVPTKLLLQLPGAYKIGFTATPSCKHAKHLPELYRDIVVGPMPLELVNSGYLSSYRHFARQRVDMSKLKKQGGEFTEASQEEAFANSVVYDGVADDLHTVAYTKCLIFTSSIKHCSELTRQLTSRGFECVEVHSGIDTAKSNYNLHQFLSGVIKICISVGVLTKGFDHPPIDLVVLNRATTSLPLYLQMCGRGSRLSPDTNKQSFTVLDYGENWKRHKSWDYEHDWGKLWNKVKRFDKEGAAPIKLCPACEFILPSSAPTCTNCGHVFIKPPPTKHETELIEITQKYRTLVGRKVSQLSPHELSIYAKEKNKKAHAVRVAKALSQSDPSYLPSFASFMGYKQSWLHFNQVPPITEPVQFFDTILK